MKDFRQLKVWEKAHKLALVAYRVTASFPSDERFGLSMQVRRCAASIPANIAEGCGRSGNGEFHRFLQIAMGSASELDYHCLLALDLGFLKTIEFEEIAGQVHEVKSMLAPLIRKVEADRK